MPPAQSPGLVLAALATIAAACSPLSPTQAPTAAGLRTQTMSTDLGLPVDFLGSEAASALNTLPFPQLSAGQLPVQTLPSGPPTVPGGMPSTAPATFPSAFPSVGASQVAFPSVAPVAFPAGLATTFPSVTPPL